MGARGRVGAADLAVIGSSGIETVRRPDPPSDLTDEQALEWREIVNRLPADWFPRETHSLLVQYCRLVVRARRLAQLIDVEEANPDFDAENYQNLVKAEEGVSRVLASLATRMRLNQSSSMRHETARKPSQLRKPWETK